jgi:uncharacterized protein YecE (DUF72 family)
VSIRVGTCSWADESFVKYFYPPDVKSSEARLRTYAELFDTVEVNSSFYALPAARAAQAWVERTPPDFTFHVKAFAMMTRHPVKVEQLPPDLRGEVELDERGRVERPPRELRAELFRRFAAEVAPLREAGKLGGILMQFPPYIVHRPQALEYLGWAREQLDGDRMLVEFRHRSWLEPDVRDDVLAFLRSIDAGYVIVDAPRTGGRNVAPTWVARSGDWAYLRLHGRNAATWNRRGGGAAERFDYLYSEDELREWVAPLRELEEDAGQVWAMFNNNGRSTDPATGSPIAQSPTNAGMLQAMLTGTETAR